MSDSDALKRCWGKTCLPVLLYEGDGPFTLVYQNEAADKIIPEKDGLSGFLFTQDQFDFAEVLKSQRTRKIGNASGAGQEGDPLFCRINGEVYCLILFLWEGYTACMLCEITAFYQRTENQMNEAIMANRAKTSFLSEMSHDIRTPMNAIMGMTDLALCNPDTPARIREYLRKIKIASDHMMSLLNEVLDMSRIESGKVLIQPEEVEIADLLHEVLVVARPQADAKGLSFQLQIGQMDHERILADGVRLKQILLNLLSNSIKFTPEGGRVSLSLEIKRQEADGQVCLGVQVADTGIGMSKDFLEKIFVPFERERSLTVSKIQGTGLGMAICKNLVELMGGWIKVESQQGKGTCFTLQIPFAIVPDRMEACREALRGRRVLLLSGEKRHQEQLSAILDRLEMHLDWADSPQQAIHQLNEAIFADWEYYALLTVEKMEGVEMLSFLSELRKRMGENFPMILLSETDWSQTEYMFTRAGISAFLPMPLFASRVAAALYEFSQEGKQEKEGQNQKTKRDFSGKRILLVEDNELNLEIATELLEMNGLVIETALDGEQAVETFAASRPFYYDLIFMDIQMPVMNGLDAARAIRGLERPDAALVPIVAMSANAFVEDVKNSIDAGMNDHISKPLDMELVLACLDRFLGR